MRSFGFYSRQYSQKGDPELASHVKRMRGLCGREDKIFVQRIKVFNEFAEARGPVQERRVFFSISPSLEGRMKQATQEGLEKGVEFTAYSQTSVFEQKGNVYYAAFNSPHELAPPVLLRDQERRGFEIPDSHRGDVLETIGFFFDPRILENKKMLEWAFARLKRLFSSIKKSSGAEAFYDIAGVGFGASSQMSLEIKRKIASEMQKGGVAIRSFAFPPGRLGISEPGVLAYHSHPVGGRPPSIPDLVGLGALERAGAIGKLGLGITGVGTHVRGDFKVCLFATFPDMDSLEMNQELVAIRFAHLDREQDTGVRGVPPYEAITGFGAFPFLSGILSDLKEAQMQGNAEKFREAWKEGLGILKGNPEARGMAGYFAKVGFDPRWVEYPSAKLLEGA